MLRKQFITCSRHAADVPKPAHSNNAFITGNRLDLLHIGAHIGDITKPHKHHPNTDFLMRPNDERMDIPVPIVVFNGGFDGGKSLHILGLVSQQLCGSSNEVPTIEDLGAPSCSGGINDFMNEKALRGKIDGQDVAYYFSNFRAKTDFDAHCENVKTLLRDETIGGMILLSNTDRVNFAKTEHQPWIEVNTHLPDLNDIIKAENLGTDTSKLFQSLASYLEDLDIYQEVRTAQELANLILKIEDYQQERVELAFEGILKDSFVRIVDISVPEKSPLLTNPYFMKLWDTSSEPLALDNQL